MLKLCPATHLRSAAFLLSTLPILPALSQTPPAHDHVHFIVQAPSTLATPLSGRLLLFLKAGTGDKEVNADELNPGSTWVGARDIQSLSAGASIEIDPDAEGIAFPTPFASIAPGDYEVQAVLDVDHTYNYSGRGPQDWISPVLSLSHWAPGDGPAPILQLTQHPAENPVRTGAVAEAKARASPGIAQLEQLQSPLLTRFWGKPVSLRPG